MNSTDAALGLLRQMQPTIRLVVEALALDNQPTEADADDIERGITELIEELEHGHRYTPAKSVPGFPGIDLQDDEIVCGDHGIPECNQGRCADLAWPTEDEAFRTLDTEETNR